MPLLFSSYDISAFTMFVAQVRYLCYNTERSVFPFLGAACKYLLASFLMTSSVDWGAELNQSVRRIQCAFVTKGLYQKTQEVLLHLPYIEKLIFCVLHENEDSMLHFIVFIY